MKALALLPLLSCLAFAADPVKTNAQLPEDKIILAKAETAGEQKVTATFKSDVVLSTVIQGNWIRTEHLVTYDVTGADAGFPLRELIFVCQDSNPTPESGIRARKVPWPFREGAMTFDLSRDKSVRHEAYYSIIRHAPVAPQK
ncbi:hypothetical protein [Luteolibacter soli]|uniref:DUF2155 domain-containing protein n=1 Tax=Luteolibacter soli TaxID=3135280 RepID=A0ABU9AYK8_9BACT